MTHFLATYEHHYIGENGYTSSDECILADSEEDLREQMAQTHFIQTYGPTHFFGQKENFNYQPNPNVTTSNWKIYRFESEVDINNTPEFKKLLEDRQARHDAFIAAQTSQKLTDQAAAKNARMAQYLKLKAEFGGDEYEGS